MEMEWIDEIWNSEELENADGLNRRWLSEDCWKS